MVDDFELRAKVVEALDACGPGVDASLVARLAQSLAHEIPLAEDEGIDFVKDILPCLRNATSYERAKPLHSFGVIFERDMPRHHRSRLRRQAAALERKTATMNGAEPRPAHPRLALPTKNAQLDYLLRKPSTHAALPAEKLNVEVARLKKEIGDLLGPNANERRYLLPPCDRDLYDDELEAAIVRAIDLRRARLASMGSHEGP